MPRSGTTCIATREFMRRIAMSREVMVAGATEAVALAHEGFTIEARLGLRASVTDSDTVCKLSGLPVDRCCLHPLLCAIGEATKGHTCMELALKTDPVAESEPAALASHLGLRSAHILCSAAIRGSMAALDVGVTRPPASDGDVDAAQSYLNDKLYTC